VLDGVRAESRLVPARALAAIAKMVESDESVDVVFAEDALAVRSGSRTLYARSLSGTFPDYQKIMPPPATSRLECSVGEMAAAIARVRTTADERSSAIKIRTSDRSLELSSQLSDVGESLEEVDSSLEGHPMEVGMNAAYLLNFLSVVGTERVALLYRDANSALEMRPAGESADYRYVVMPMRI
jgi:DNA polymerase-3 subunit beta